MVIVLPSNPELMKPSAITTAPETSAFMREMWAAEAEHPVFAGSLQNFRLMLGAERPKVKRAARAKKKIGPCRS